MGERTGQEQVQESSVAAAVLSTPLYFGVGKSFSNIPKSMHPCLLKYTLLTFSQT